MCEKEKYFCLISFLLIVQCLDMIVWLCSYPLRTFSRVRLAKIWARRRVSRLKSWKFISMLNFISRTQVSVAKVRHIIQCKYNLSYFFFKQFFFEKPKDKELFYKKNQTKWRFKETKILQNSLYIQMKGDKVFVRYKNLNQNHQSNREKQPRKPHPQRKKYAEKSNKTREAIRQIINTFKKLQETPKNISQLANDYPKFFSKRSYSPEKDTNDSLNDYIIINAKKYIQSLNYSKKQTAPMISSSEPDWNSDEDIDENLESKAIEATVVQKVVERLGNQLSKKPEILKRHERQFLQDYIRTKRNQQQADAANQQKKDDKILPSNPTNTQKNAQPVPKPQTSFPEQDQKTQSKPRNIWSQYQEQQVNSFVDMGYMTKIDDNQQQIQAQLALDNDMFCDEDEQQIEQKSVQQKSHSQSDGDDIFGDETPTTTIKTTKQGSDPKIQSEKAVGQGTVLINTQIFAKIAEQVGIIPRTCKWIISNEKEKYQVSTQYMDKFYRLDKIFEILPFISLYHSDFVRNQEAETPKALEIFRKYNSRKQKKFQYAQKGGGKSQYKEKTNTHPQKK